MESFPEILFKYSVLHKTNANIMLKSTANRFFDAALMINNNYTIIAGVKKGLNSCSKEKQKHSGLINFYLITQL